LQRKCLCCVVYTSQPFPSPIINDTYSFTRVEYQTDVELHFAAIPADRKIDVSTIHQLLGVGAHSCEAIDEALHHYKQCKRDVRSWAAAQIKAIIRENAQKIVMDDNTVEMHINNNCKILDFTDLIKWWKENCKKEDKRYANSLYHACYDKFFPGWEVTLENEFMTLQSWKYSQSSIKKVLSAYTRTGFTMKGCIAKSISNVKCELMKQVNLVGKKWVFQ
jgi:hypothetical protein